jgi:hypothetical protein
MACLSAALSRAAPAGEANRRQRAAVTRIARIRPKVAACFSRYGAEETVTERRRQIAGGLGLTIESEDLYEAAVIEFEGARIS